MKISVLFYTICLLYSVNSFAQSSLAIRGGINASTVKALYSGNKADQSFTFGPHAGIQLDAAFDGALHFAPFIAYNMRGFIIRNPNDSVNQIKNRINYIDLAPVLRYYLDEPGKKQRYYLSAGPIMSIAFSGKEQTSIRGNTTNRKMPFSLSKDYGFFDMSMYGAVGIRLKKWYVEASYQYGMFNINNNARQDKRNLQNRTIGIHAGFFIRDYK